MSKTNLFVLLAVTGAMLFATEASARGRRWGCSYYGGTTYMNGSCNTGNVTYTATMPANTTMTSNSQSGDNSHSTYQSFSYEPDASATTSATTVAQPVTAPNQVYYQAPYAPTIRSTSPAYHSGVNGNYKMRQFTGEN